MKRKVLIGSIIFVFLVGGFFALIYVWNIYTIKQNIKIATERYEGTDEEALIAYMQDESNSPSDRTHIAIWTLGQIKSEKALPFLYLYYKNDPQGNTCYELHHSKLCQYEIYKAIVNIEGTISNKLPE